MATRLMLSSGFLICIIAAALVCGCIREPVATIENRAATPRTPQELSAGLPNPASEYCSKVGILKIEKDTTGNEYGICTFSNATSCDMWALSRNVECSPGT